MWPQSERILFLAGVGGKGGVATYSSSNTQESAAFRLFRLKEERGRGAKAETSWALTWSAPVVEREDFCITHL